MLSGARFEAWADRGEKILFAVIFAIFFVEFAWSFIDKPNIITGLYLADQTLVMLFLLLGPLGLWLGNSGVERAMLIGSLILVMVAELLNGSIEAIVDKTTPEFHELA